MALVTDEFHDLVCEGAAPPPAAVPPASNPHAATCHDGVDRLMQHVQSWPLWITLAAVIAYIVVVVCLDWCSGEEFPLAVLYLPAAVIVCWRINLRYAQILSFGCAALWLLVDLLQAGTFWPQTSRLWIAGSHLMFFLVVVNVLWRLQVALAREQEAATTDPLTGLHNTRWFMEQAEMELERSRRLKRPVSVVFIDCDNFKHINDTLGHRAGDQLLEAVGTTLKGAVRLVDVVARIGGDEFALLLPDVGRDFAQPIVGRLRDALLAEMRRQGWPSVTFSIGVATFEDLPEEAEDLISAADSAMYVIKHGTKNGIHFQNDERGLLVGP